MAAWQSYRCWPAIQAPCRNWAQPRRPGGSIPARPERCRRAAVVAASRNKDMRVVEPALQRKCLCCRMVPAHGDDVIFLKQQSALKFSIGVRKTDRARSLSPVTSASRATTGPCQGWTMISIPGAANPSAFNSGLMTKWPDNPPCRYVSSAAVTQEALRADQPDRPHPQELS